MGGGLPAVEQSQDHVDVTSHDVRIRERLFAVVDLAAGLAGFGVVVQLALQPMPARGGEVGPNAVEFQFIDARGEGQRGLQIEQHPPSDRSGQVVELTPPVAEQGEPMPAECPEDKTAGGRDDLSEVGECQDHDVWWWVRRLATIFIVAFVAGFAMTSGFRR